MRLFLAFLCLLLSLPTFAQTSKAKPLPFATVEAKMFEGGYPGSLEAAYWAAGEGDRVVPALTTMLNRLPQYKKKAEDGGSLYAFPFNALWALGHIPSEKARATLANFLKTTHDADAKKTATLALKASRLRQAKKQSILGVFGEGGLTDLYAKPSGRANVIVTLKAGEPVRILKEGIENPKEEGPRGGPSLFDYVEVLATGKKGYVLRAGDDFSPFF